jgi:hypothetical protein
MFTPKRVLALVAVLGASIGLPTISQADTVNYDLAYNCGGSGTCSNVGVLGTVSVTTAANGSSVTYDFKTSSPTIFWGSGLNTWLFDVTGTITSESIAVTGGDAGNTYAFLNPATKTDGLGSGWMAYDCTDSSSGNNCGTEAKITISGSGLAAAFNTVGGLDFFAGADLNCNGNTACVNFTTGMVGAVAPLPGAVVLFGSVLFGGLGMSQWRKRRARGPVSVIA